MLWASMQTSNSTLIAYLKRPSPLRTQRLSLSLLPHYYRTYWCLSKHIFQLRNVTSPHRNQYYQDIHIQRALSLSVIRLRANKSLNQANSHAQRRETTPDEIPAGWKTLQTHRTVGARASRIKMQRMKPLIPKITNMHDACFVNSGSDLACTTHSGT